jgi:hypothetical protein
MAMESATPTPDDRIDDIADGQRMIIFAILLNIATAIVVTTVAEIFGLIGIGAVVLAIIGLLNVASGLGYSTGVKVLLIVLVFVPIASLLMLVIVNGKATEALKAHGFKVGLLGARKP